jgi:predicted nucleotidyltransferase
MSGTMDRFEMIHFIHAHLAEMERFDVRALALYGPAAQDMASPKGDIDVVVEFEHAPTFESYMGLKRFLERHFQQRVDISTPDSLEPEIFADVMYGVIHVIGDVAERWEASRRESGAPPPKPLREAVIDVIHSHREELEELGARSISLFGSVARGEVGPHSDIDILVEFAGPVGMSGFFGVKHLLEDLLHRPVDLGTANGLKEGMRARIMAEAIEIWRSAAVGAAGVATDEPS